MRERCFVGLLLLLSFSWTVGADEIEDLLEPLEPPPPEITPPEKLESLKGLHVVPGRRVASVTRSYDSPFRCRLDPDYKAELIKKHGGNRDSEAAVAAALKWLADHQLDDGSWNFDHRRGGPSRKDPGSLTTAPRAATGLALLPFLAADNTHQHGPHKQTVRKAIIYLIRNMKMSKEGTGTFEEPGGRLYSHGIVTLALCEAYGMTGDDDLQKPAQAAVNHISYAQDPIGGGWSYTVKQPGDTSVTAWQLLALKAAHLSHLEVRKNTVAGSVRYLDSVQSNSGAEYGYTRPGKGRCTSAKGLLCRMYLGWKVDSETLQRGIGLIAEHRPAIRSMSDMYLNYFVTQVLFQLGADDPNWLKWNVAMRDYLVNHQATEGAEKGSWHLTGSAAERSRVSKGGRLYHTALAALTLQVYYRDPAIYPDAPPVEEDFEL
jgi:hypothetical protein